MDSQRTLLHSVDETIRELLKQIDPMDLACHNVGYAPAGDLFEELVVPERERYLLALGMLDGLRPGRAADLGCFFPYMPILLTKLGWNVTAVDRYSLYGPSMRQALEETARLEGFILVDLDLTSELDQLGEVDLVLLMAVVEHLNGSPLAVMGHIRDLLSTRLGTVMCCLRFPI